MHTKTSQKAVLITRALRMGILGVFALFVCIALASVFLVHVTSAATSSTVNFQARLEQSNGAIAPDGNYNVEFKLYSAATGGTAEWTEDYTYNSGAGGTDARLYVANGYLTVSLGSLTAFPTSIDWSQQQWLTMNIGGTGSTGSFPTMGDGEMSPRLQLTAVPYAFQAGSAAQLSVNQGTFSGILNFATLSGGNQTFQLPNEAAAGTYSLLTKNQADAGYIQLQATTPGTPQTGNFNISGTGIAGAFQAGSLDTASAAALGLGQTNATAVNIGNTTTNILTTLNGTVLVKPTSGHDSTTAFQVQTAGGTGILTADTTNMALVVGNDGTPNALTIRGGVATGSNTAGANLTFDASNGTGMGGSGAFIFRTSTGAQGIQFDTVSRSLGNTSGSLTWTHAIGSFSNMALIVGVNIDNTARSVASITYKYNAGANQQSLTKVDSGSTGAYDVEMWYLASPVVGSSPSTNTITVTLTGGATDTIYASAETFYNVDPTTPLDVANEVKKTGSVGSGTNTVSVTVNNTSLYEDTIDIFGNDNSGFMPAPCSGQTQQLGKSNQLWGSYKAAAATSTTMCWSNLNSTGYVEMAVPLKPNPSTTPDALSDRLHITSSGNIGINNANPQYALDVTGSGNFGTSVLTPIVDTASAAALGLGQTNATAVNIGNTTTNILTTLNGTVLVKPTSGHDSTTAFQVQTAGGTGVLSVDTVNSRVGVGNTNPQAALEVDYNLTGTPGAIPGLILKNTHSGGTGSQAELELLAYNNGSGGTPWVLSADDDINQLRIYNGTAERIRIDGNSTYIQGQANTYLTTTTATLYVGEDSTTSRSINAAGTINASGADYAEWIPWSGTKPLPGSVVPYQGSVFIVSSPFTAAFIGNENADEAHAILVTFAGQVPVRVTGPVAIGDLLVDNGDGTARAIAMDKATFADYTRKVGIAWSASSDSGVTMIIAAVGTSSSNGIQDTIAPGLLTLDASLNQVKVGSGASGEASATLLVLDSQTGSSRDPAGVRGAMYYNATMNTFRCYTSGNWQNCTPGTAFTFSTAGGAPSTQTLDASGTILIAPLYVSGQITVNTMRVEVTTTLGARGDIGVYDAAGTLVLDGGAGSLDVGIGLQSIVPVQTDRVLEPGQYYVAVTWDSTTGAIRTDALTVAGVVNHAGSVDGGGRVLPQSISLNDITDQAYMPLFTLSN